MPSICDGGSESHDKFKVWKTTALTRRQMFCVGSKFIIQSVCSWHCLRKGNRISFTLCRGAGDDCGASHCSKVHSTLEVEQTEIDR